MRGLRLLPLLTVAVTLLCGVGSAAADTWYSVNDPIDPAYLTEMPFGLRSDWIQQWRAYLDTPPAATLRDGIGVNLNVDPSQAAVTARLLGASGVTRARVEISWSGVNYDSPTVFANAAQLSSEIRALRNNGIRPLILLNANQQLPGPTQSFNATLTADAAAGATTVQLDAGTAAAVVPGYSGLNDGSQAAGIIFTAVDQNDVATLSRPLPTAFPAGSYPASTLLYQPFAQPELADGSPNPQFEATLQGWLGYVRMTMELVTNAYGSSNFDVEVWNELGFGSDFLNLANYYDPLPDATQGDTDTAILDATVAFLKDPANGWTGVQVGDGFTDQTPVDSGVGLPAGLSAIDKHPYVQLEQYPWQEEGQIELDALGEQDRTSLGVIENYFEPTYNAFFPEFTLTGINTETLIRDIAPVTTSIGGEPLGRDSASPGVTAPGMWVTETGMDPTNLQNFPDPLTSSDYDHIHAKAALRTYVSFIGKGVRAVDIYAVNGAPQWNLVDPGFFSAAYNAGSGTYSYPGAAAGGPVMAAIGRLAATVAGAQTITTPRPLSLLAISTDSDAYQFVGNGSASYPDLYDRDVLMFQPFQLTDSSWVAGVYVMTRNIAKVYNESLPESDPTRTDLPAETYQITIGGVDATNLSATATDPLSGQSVPVQITSRDGDEATIELPVTDSPRMVTLEDPPSAPPSTLPTAPTTQPGVGEHTPTPSTGGHTKAAGGSRTPPRLAASSSVSVVGRDVYLELECTVACRARWSLRTPGVRDRPSGSSRLLARHRTRIRIAQATSARRPHGTVAITITDQRTKATIEQHRTIG